MFMLPLQNKYCTTFVLNSMNTTRMSLSNPLLKVHYHHATLTKQDKGGCTHCAEVKYMVIFRGIWGGSKCPLLNAKEGNPSLS